MTSRTGSNQRGKRGEGRGKSAAATTPWPLARFPQRGLTLIEVLLSVIVLATGVVLILQAFATSSRVLLRARNRLDAYTFASAKMGDLESAFQQRKTPKLHGVFHNGTRKFTWHVTTTPTESDPALHEVALTVGWKQGLHDFTTGVTTLAHIEAPEGVNE